MFPYIVQLLATVGGPPVLLYSVLAEPLGDWVAVPRVMRAVSDLLILRVSAGPQRMPLLYENGSHSALFQQIATRANKMK
jgi:hypothetical protein